MFFLILVLVSLIIYWILEFRAHQRRVYSIPIRIHINGTRGKSSVTRLVAAGLRAGGIKTMAKTTGTLPRIIDEKGLEVSVVRPQTANIIEQIKIIRYMARRKPEAVVMECMAVQPEYQWISEHRFIHSTIGLITNTRLDHVREMGPTIENITRSICNTLPRGGVSYTSERKMYWLMQKQARKIGCQLHQIDPSQVTDEEMRGFDHIEHADNVSLALATCDKLGIPRAMALEGMYRSHPDVGALRVFQVVQDGRVIHFVHAMAANDPESTIAIWEKTKNHIKDLGVVAVLLHTRADRYDRALQLLEMIGQDMADEHHYLFLTGEKTASVFAALPRYGLDQKKALNLAHATPEHIYHEVLERVASKGTLFSIGNVGAGGLHIVQYFRERRTDISEDAKEIT